MLQTRVISAFPGTGKSHLCKNCGELKILDSDSSNFSWVTTDLKGGKVRNPEFPKNYIEHIKDNLGKVDLILVSSHADVRKALVEEDIFFELVIPNPEQKDVYIQRYKDRGSPEGFINMVEAAWENWMADLLFQRSCRLIVLPHNTYLSDYVQNQTRQGTKPFLS